ncbi:protein of unknown function [Modestobacter italicus]|uniref:Uncharacterized protein n=1 Tax=Modestobacter italicus (strain DSM 44449 / CECT 9708 / BC 501) TaxID=2732864 RepID=I4F0F4_MODI5|nr:protein of unknown function [Modestobacter marinus]
MALAGHGGNRRERSPGCQVIVASHQLSLGTQCAHSHDRMEAEGHRMAIFRDLPLRPELPRGAGILVAA